MYAAWELPAVAVGKVTAEVMDGAFVDRTNTLPALLMGNFVGEVVVVVMIGSKGSVKTLLLSPIGVREVAIHWPRAQTPYWTLVQGEPSGRWISGEQIPVSC